MLVAQKICKSCDRCLALKHKTCRYMSILAKDTNWDGIDTVWDTGDRGRADVDTNPI